LRGHCGPEKFHRDLDIVVIFLYNRTITYDGRLSCRSVCHCRMTASSSQPPRRGNREVAHRPPFWRKSPKTPPRHSSAQSRRPGALAEQSQATRAGIVAEQSQSTKRDILAEQSHREAASCGKSNSSARPSHQPGFWRNKAKPAGAFRRSAPRILAERNTLIFTSEISGLPMTDVEGHKTTTSCGRNRGAKPALSGDGARAGRGAPLPLRR
jgi:hypothetical protein